MFVLLYQGDLGRDVIILEGRGACILSKFCRIELGIAETLLTSK